MELDCFSSFLKAMAVKFLDARSLLIAIFELSGVDYPHKHVIRTQFAVFEKSHTMFVYWNSNVPAGVRGYYFDDDTLYSSYTTTFNAYSREVIEIFSLSQTTFISSCYAGCASTNLTDCSCLTDDYTFEYEICRSDCPKWRHPIWITIAFFNTICNYYFIGIVPALMSRDELYPTTSFIQLQWLVTNRWSK